MSDRIAVMNRGRVEQVDDAATVFERPATEFVANFMGASNFFAAARARGRRGRASRSTWRRAGRCGFRSTGRGTARREEVRFVVRPEKLDLRARDLSRHGVPSVAVTVEERVYQGISTVWIVRDAADERFVVYEQNEKPFEESARFAVGSRLFVCWNPKHAVHDPNGRRAPRERTSRAPGAGGLRARPARPGSSSASSSFCRSRSSSSSASASARPTAGSSRSRTSEPTSPRASSSPTTPARFHADLPPDLLAVDLDGRRDDRPLPRRSATRSPTTSRWSAPAKRRNLLLGLVVVPVLDELPDPHLRLDVHPADRGPRQQAAHGARA